MTRVVELTSAAEIEAAIETMPGRVRRGLVSEDRRRRLYATLELAAHIRARLIHPPAYLDVQLPLPLIDA